MTFRHFGNRGFERQRTRGTLASRFPESRKPIALRRQALFGILGTGCSRGQESGDRESRLAKSQNRESLKSFRGIARARVVKPFRHFGNREFKRTRSLGELACRSPETPKRERCVGSEQRRASKRGCVHRFSQDLCQRTKGPVDLFKGF
jgi:hypothetical protein